MRRTRRLKNRSNAWLIGVGVFCVWLFVGYPALAQWNPAPGTAPPSNNLPGPIWNASAPGFGSAQTASILITGNATFGGGGAFGGYSFDPAHSITAPSAYFGVPGVGSTTIDSTGVTTDALTLTNGAADGSILVSDATGKATWQVLSIGECIGPSGKYDHMSAASYSGQINVAGSTGYAGANAACGAGSHICTPDELLSTVRCSPASLPASGNVWLANGAPSFTSPAANDCAGWTSSVATTYGSFWQFSGANGGKGFSTSCNLSLKIACCAD